ncbi:MAG: beta-ketoacyl-ACP synthase III [Chitinophagales bacterium]
MTTKQPIYITRLATFLPNQPVDNADMERYLGMLGGKPSKSKAMVLRNNGIKTRHYALDANGRPTHTNAQLAAAALNQLFDTKFSREKLQLLTCGTTSPDQLLPSHASMVLGELGGRPIEALSPSGSCCTGLQAMNYAYLSLLAGNYENAAVVGSERLSGWVKSNSYQEEAEKVLRLEGNPMLAFEKDFLRWMLSDGAAACLLQTTPNTEGLSYRVEWIELKSFASELPVCMYVGANKNEDGTTTGFADIDQSRWLPESVFAMKQDTRVLGDSIVKCGGVFLKEICEKRQFDVSSIDFFCPHLSSEFFGLKIDAELQAIGLPIPREKWFYNLTRVGNIGAASQFAMLDELMRSGRLQKGHKVLVMVPESARFSYGYLLVTAV